VQSWLGWHRRRERDRVSADVPECPPAFEQVDIELIYAGRTLGMSERRIFWRVVLPSAGRAWVAARF
jgi:molybdate transport system permease protein